MSIFTVKDYKETYSEVMKFEKNKSEIIHGWYPFVEGYSKEFINSILDELEFKPQFALDPFGGSGTTALHMQQNNIACNSFEVNPFMHLLATTKMQTGYDLNRLEKVKSRIERDLSVCKKDISDYNLPPGNTLVEREGLKKWIFHKEVMLGLLDIKESISLISDEKYRNVFSITLASILLEVSNVYRNGKCVSYKKNWDVRVKLIRKDVHQKFLQKIEEIIIPDLKVISQSEEPLVNNATRCYLGDVRKGIHELDNNETDLVITSPPYLNSRDYTDIYRIELWMLGLIKSYEAMHSLRKETLISHVQCSLGDIEEPNSYILKAALKELGKDKVMWNKNIPSMVKGYFRDIDFLFMNLYSKMSGQGKVYFNVANSAYNGVLIKVDEIVSELAEMNGFRVEEIREARYLRPSGQQKDKIDGLRESVIVLRTEVY